MEMEMEMEREANRERGEEGVEREAGKGNVGYPVTVRRVNCVAPVVGRIPGIDLIPRDLIPPGVELVVACGRVDRALSRSRGGIVIGTL